MTELAADPVPTSDPDEHVAVQVRRALRLLTLGWDAALSALLADDPRVARTVLRTAPARRQAIRVAAHRARHDGGDGAADALPVLAESEQVNRLLAQLAQTVLTDHTRPLVDELDRPHVEAVRRRGTERLCQLAGAPHLPVADDAYRTCGAALQRACEGLHDHDLEHSPAARTCGELTTYLVDISRHVSRLGLSSSL